MKQVVLDTHVWLDILVFDEPSSQSLKPLLGIHGKALGDTSPSITTEALCHPAPYQAIISTPCLDELQRVLFYPTIQKFWHKKMGRALDEVDCAWITEQIAQYALWIDMDVQTMRSIPICQDPKDQMLIELACQGQAVALISQDLLVLRLAKAMLPFGCQVLTMKDFLKNSLLTSSFQPVDIQNTSTNLGN